VDFFDVKTLDDVLKIVTQNREKRVKIHTEWVTIDEAVGRVLASTCMSPVDLPDFNRSTVDGYAVFASEVFGACESIPSLLSLNGEVIMGDSEIPVLKSNEAIYVPTGGAVPHNADGVVMIEFTDKMDAQTLLVKHPIHVGENITFKGDDVKVDECVFEKGRRLSVYDIGLLAGIGIPSVEVYKKIRVTVISTGDELISVDAPASFGKIRDINGNALSAALRAYGAEVNGPIHVLDNFDQLKSAYEVALLTSDCVLISGGSSVGVRDYTCEVITHFDDSELLVHGIAVKPGKPTIVGRIGEKLVFGLPGHPSAALLLYNLVVIPYLETLVGASMEAIKVPAILCSRVHGAPGRDAFIMVSLEIAKDGFSYLAKPVHAKSGMITLLSNATGYIRLSRDQEGLNEGSLVMVTLLRHEKFGGQ